MPLNTHENQDKLLIQSQTVSVPDLLLITNSFKALWLNHHLLKILWVSTIPWVGSWRGGEPGWRSPAFPGAPHPWKGCPEVVACSPWVVLQWKERPCSYWASAVEATQCVTHYRAACHQTTLIRGVGKEVPVLTEWAAKWHRTGTQTWGARLAGDHYVNNLPHHWGTAGYAHRP